MAVFTFSDFVSISGFTLLGNASYNVNNGVDASRVLRLTSALAAQKGGLFSNNKFDCTWFDTQFTFRLGNNGGNYPDGSGQPGGDGFCFVLQNIASTAIGYEGGALGFFGIGSPSFAVEFDTWRNVDTNTTDPSSNHLGINTNGSISSLVTKDIATQFNNNALWTVNILYYLNTLIIKLNGSEQLRRTIDIPTLMGSDRVYVGFTAGTGGQYSTQDIVTWSYSSLDEYNGFWTEELRSTESELDYG